MANDRVGEQLALGFGSHFSHASRTLAPQTCMRLRPPFRVRVHCFYSAQMPLGFTAALAPAKCTPSPAAWVSWAVTHSSMYPAITLQASVREPGVTGPVAQGHLPASLSCRWPQESGD